MYDAIIMRIIPTQRRTNLPIMLLPTQPTLSKQEQTQTLKDTKPGDNIEQPKIDQYKIG